MMRDGGLTYWKLSREIAGRKFTICERLQNLPPEWIGQSRERGNHELII